MRAYRVFLFMQMAVSLVLAAIFTASSVYQVTVAGLTPLQLVLVGTTLELSIFLFEVPTGVVADVYSRRLSIIIGYILMGLGFILEGAIPWFWTILLAQVLWGVGYTFTSGATQAWISDEIGEDAANKAFLRAGQLDNLGGLVGIGLGVALGLAGINLPIVIGGVFLVGLSAILLLVMPEQGFKPNPHGERNTWQRLLGTFRQGVRTVRGRPLLLDILLIGFFYGLYSEGFDRLWMKHVLDNFTLPSWLNAVTASGIVRVGSALLGIGVVEVLHRNLDTGRIQHLAITMFTATFVLSLALMAFAWSGDSFWWIVVVMWLISISRQVIGPLYTAWVNQKLDSQVRATVISMSSQVDAIGQIVGGPGVGWIGSALSVRTALSVSSTLLAPVLVLLIKARRDHA